MWNLTPGDAELVAPKGSSQGGLNIKKNPFSQISAQALRKQTCYAEQCHSVRITRDLDHLYSPVDCTGREGTERYRVRTSKSGSHRPVPPEHLSEPAPNQAPAAVARGKGLFETNCAFCHGAEATGGNCGPDLLRSVLVNHDEKGELIGPVIRDGRASKGMPNFNLGDVKSQTSLPSSISAITMHAFASPTKSLAWQSAIHWPERPISNRIVPLVMQPTTTWWGSHQNTKAMNCNNDGLIRAGNRRM